MTEQTVPVEYAWIKPGAWAEDNHGFRCLVKEGPRISRAADDVGEWVFINTQDLPVLCQFVKPAPMDSDDARLDALEAEVDRLTRERDERSPLNDLGEARMMIANLNRKVGDLEAENQRLTDALAAIRGKLEDDSDTIRRAQNHLKFCRVGEMNPHQYGMECLMINPALLALIGEIQALAGVEHG